ncbi:MAG: hypothetical protein Q9226_004886 [Calogaya cf. arnoldii]
MPQSKKPPAYTPEPRVTSPSKAWYIFSAKHSSNPNQLEKFQETYLLTSGQRANILKITIYSPDNESPFHFEGNVIANPDTLHDLDHPNQLNILKSFRIHGTWTSSDNGEGVFTYNAVFHVVEGSGTKGYEGITGAGRLDVTGSDSDPDSPARGTCFFDRMNEVGASLM